MGGTPAPKESILLPRERWLQLVPVVLIIPAVLFLAYRWNPQFSHNLAEMFSVTVACSVFMLTWNARKYIDNHYFIILGIAYLFVGVIDYLHAALFEGVFSPDSAYPLHRDLVRRPVPPELRAAFRSVLRLPQDPSGTCVHRIRGRLHRAGGARMERRSPRLLPARQGGDGRKKP